MGAGREPHIDAVAAAGRSQLRERKTRLTRDSIKDPATRTHGPPSQADLII